MSEHERSATDLLLEFADRDGWGGLGVRLVVGCWVEPGVGQVVGVSLQAGDGWAIQRVMARQAFVESGGVEAAIATWLADRQVLMVARALDCAGETVQ